MGIGVNRNISTAVMWYTLAAEQGNTSAQYRLETMNLEAKAEN
jgi:TPR repeat protein